MVEKVYDYDSQHLAAEEHSNVSKDFRSGLLL